MPEDSYILFNIFSHFCDAKCSFVPGNRNPRSFFDERMESARGTGVAPFWQREAHSFCIVEERKKEGEHDIKARDVMNKRVTAATPRAIGRDLALKLLSGMYSGLPVVDAKGAVVGVVTEFDLLMHAGCRYTCRSASHPTRRPGAAAGR